MKIISKKACQACEKSIRKKQNSLECSSCEHSFHQKCTAITPSQFFDIYKGNKDQKYTCENCIITNRSNVGVTEILNQSDANYHSICDLNEKLKSKSNADFFVVHYNIVSLIPHKDSISSMISKMHVKPDAICISESRLMDKKIKWQSMLVEIPGYDLKYDNSTSAGGVAIYVNNMIKNFKVLTELKLDVVDCESIFLEIYFDKNTKRQAEKTSKKKTFLLGCVYRHPRWGTDVFNNQLFEKLSIYSEKNIPILLLGDINIDVLENDERSKTYVNVLSSVGCKNWVEVPTCFSDSSRSCVDHIITNLEPNELAHGVLDETPTDHVPIFAIYKVGNFSYKKQSEEEDSLKWRFFDDRKKEQFLNTLEKNLSIIDLGKHPEVILKSLTHATQSAIDKWGRDL